jgi:hypothetical protein
MVIISPTFSAVANREPSKRGEISIAAEVAQ